MTPKQFETKYSLILTTVRQRQPRKTSSGPVYDYDCILNKIVGPDSHVDGLAFRYTLTKPARLKAPRMAEVLKAIAQHLREWFPGGFAKQLQFRIGDDAPNELLSMLPK